MAMLPVHDHPDEAVLSARRRPRLVGGSVRGLAGKSDERLAEIAVQGDERAFEVLYERHSPAILRYCRSLLRSQPEAEDVAQEVFVLAISALRRGVRPESFRPWLYRVAHNACVSQLRVRRPVLVADNGVLVGPAAMTEPVEESRQALRELLDDIGTLPEVQRGALLLREVDGYSYEQVSEVLGLSLSTVRSSIFRARRTLQGLAEARNADCDAIRSELSRLAARRGRRSREITSHLRVCQACCDFRDGLRQRPAVLNGIAPAGAGMLAPLKALLGSIGLGGNATATATGAGLAAAGAAGGGLGGAKALAVAASACALLAGAGYETERLLEREQPAPVAAVTSGTPARPSTTAAPAQAPSGGQPSAMVAGPAPTQAVTVETLHAAGGGLATSSAPYAVAVPQAVVTAGAPVGSPAAPGTAPGLPAPPAPSESSDHQAPAQSAEAARGESRTRSQSRSGRSPRIDDRPSPEFADSGSGRSGGGRVSPGSGSGTSGSGIPRSGSSTGTSPSGGSGSGSSRSGSSEPERRDSEPRDGSSRSSETSREADETHRERSGEPSPEPAAPAGLPEIAGGRLDAADEGDRLSDASLPDETDEPRAFPVRPSAPELGAAAAGAAEPKPPVPADLEEAAAAPVSAPATGVLAPDVASGVQQF